MNQEVMELIQQRRKQILVHSHLYYQMNENIISDSTYDRWCKELAELQVQFPNEAKIAMHDIEFQGFDGSSGYDLPFNSPEWHSKAMWLLRTHKEKTSTG